MNKRGPIVVIEDDKDDQYMYEVIFKDLGFENPVILFTEGDSALEYLKRPEVYPFLVISDINMPKLNGYALRDHIQTDKDLRDKCIPFIFFTTASSKDAVIKAYNKCIQGFFIKPNTTEALKATLHAVVKYWQLCYSPARAF